MKALFYSSYHATPHMETELEIAARLIEEGHEVYFLRCTGELSTCYANPKHLSLDCKLCVSKVSNAYARLDLPPGRILTFPKVAVPDPEIDFAKMDVDALKRLTYKGFDIGMGISSSLISYTRDHRPDLSRHADYLRRGYKASVFAYEAAVRILETLSPDCVYLFNGRFLEVRPFMRVCEKMGIRYFTHERGGVLQRYMLRERSIPHSLSVATAEIRDLWGEGGSEKETIGRKFFEDRRKRVIQGWHTFTNGQVEQKLPAGFTKERENVVIFNSSMDEYEGIAGFTNPVYKDDNDGLERILAHFKEDHSRHFYLRIHPNLRGLDNAQLREIKRIAAVYDNLTVIAAEEDVDTYALMDAADKVLTFGSTMGAESVFWNKPVILVGRAFYEELDCLYRPGSHSEVVKQLEAPDLRPYNQTEILKYGYWSLLFGEPYKRYRSVSVVKGTFDGRPIHPALVWRGLYVMRNKLQQWKVLR